MGGTGVEVDALGELAAVDDAALLWDTADPLAPLAWLGDQCRSPGWPAGEADWQGTPGAPRDPFGAPLAPPEPGLRLGYRGELEFAGLTWLRARAYDPATRAFLSPDPLPPVLGTAYSANPYHYAGNDPLGSADPLGLRPVTEQELRDIRDRMGQNWVSRNKDWLIAGALIVGGVVGDGHGRRRADRGGDDRRRAAQRRLERGGAEGHDRQRQLQGGRGRGPRRRPRRRRWARTSAPRGRWRR